MKKLIQPLVRFLPLPIAAVLMFLYSFNIGKIPIMDENMALLSKCLGLFFPAFWLAGVGKKGLIEEGGFLMRLFKIKSSREQVAIIGLFWFVLFLVCQIILAYKEWQNAFWSYFLYGFSYAGLMGSLGVYICLATYKQKQVK